MEWDPTRFFRTDVDPPAPFALLVLNQPINENAFGVLAGHGMFIFFLFKIVLYYTYHIYINIHMLTQNSTGHRLRRWGRKPFL